MIDYNKACKGLRSRECEKCEISKILEANMESYDSKPEEGQIIEEGEQPRSESPTHNDIVASAIELSLSAEEAIEKKQVHIRQSTSLQRASDEGDSATTVVVQQSVIDKDTATASATEANMESYDSEPEEGQIIEEGERHRSERPKELRTSAQGMVEEELLTSPQRGSLKGGSASTAVVQRYEYTASEGQHSNVGQSTLHKTCCGEHGRSYSPTVYISSKERHKKRKQDCFGYSDYQLALHKIKEICSERFSKLLLRQNGDRKKFEIMRKEQELEFFQEHVHSYKVHYTHVIPTIRNCRMKLPRRHFNILRKRFHKHMQSQLKIFVKQQIKDRDKENRIKHRWIFEAKAGYLKKCFYDISLPYSEFKWEKLEWHMTDYSDGEEHLKNYDMQSLTTQIEAIASNREPEGSFASDVSEPVVKTSQSMLETNGATKLGFSVGVAEEMSILESRSCQPACAPTMDFCEKDGTQLAFSVIAAENERGNMDRPDDSQSLMSAALQPTKAVTAGKTSDVCESNLETNGATDLGFSFDVAEKMATLESSSSKSTCAPAQIAFSAAAQNEVGNMEKPCASQSATNAALELEMAVTPYSQNAPLTSKEKRRCISSSNDTSEGPCSRSEREFGKKDGTQIAFGKLARSCASRSVTNAALELAMTVNTDSENAPPISNETRRRISSGNNISEGPSSTSRIKFPYESTWNLSRTALHREEPPAVRPPPYLGSINQMAQAEDTRIKEVPSHHAQVTKQPNIHSNTQSSMAQYHCSSTCQTSTHTYRPPAGNDSLDVPNVHPASSNQVPTGYIPGQCLAEDGLQPDPLTIELQQLQVWRDLIEKIHIEKQEQLILAREMELAEAKRKYDERVYKAEVEVLQQKRDIQIMLKKIYNQHILAELYQAMFKSSAKVVPDGVRGSAQRTMAEPSCSSDQHFSQPPASVSTPASAAMYQPPQSFAQASTGASIGQPRSTLQHAAMEFFGRSTTTLMNNPSGGIGSAQRTMVEPSRSSDQHFPQPPASVSTPASVAMYQPPQSFSQASTATSLRQHRVTLQRAAMEKRAAMESFGRSTTTPMHNPSGGIGSAQRTMAEPSRSSDQHFFHPPACVSTPASAAMYQPPQLFSQASTATSLRQHRATLQRAAMEKRAAMESFGRSTTTPMHNPSGGIGSAQRTMAEPSRSSDQHFFHPPACVSTPASVAMYQPPQSFAQASTATSLGQHRVTLQHAAMQSFGRSITTPMHNPSGGMGNGFANHRQAPHLP